MQRSGETGGGTEGRRESRLDASVQMQKYADSLKVAIYITEVYQQRCGWAPSLFWGRLDLSVGYDPDETLLSHWE